MHLREFSEKHEQKVDNLLCLDHHLIKKIKDKFCCRIKLCSKELYEMQVIVKYQKCDPQLYCESRMRKI